MAFLKASNPTLAEPSLDAGGLAHCAVLVVRGQVETIGTVERKDQVPGGRVMLKPSGFPIP